ncbi:MAG: hypothetical protein DHS20C15_31480 [Planctomycetota bacterium]|nr:MAG: hypothetical protein DHS20C15_31480 [Planctomycetota bacterium]
MRVTRLEVENYRTLEQLSLDLDPSFAAICGPNDSGKTNVIRALRSVLREEAPPYLPFIESTDLSVKHDWPKWKEKNAGSVRIAVTLDLDPHKDAGLYQFILRQFKKEPTEENLLVEVELTQGQTDRTHKVTVTLAGERHSGIEAEDVLNRLHGAKAIFYHNSTQAFAAMPFQRGFGRLKELSADPEAVEKIQSGVAKGMKKIARSRKDELEQLLGRLGNKYKLALTLPQFDVSEMPFEVTLEESKAVVPLDDWGSGTRNRTLILYLLFAARQAQSAATSADKVTPLIVIEEPECFLHPVAQAEFGRLLQALADEFGVQVIVTTHSPYMLSTEKPESNVLLDRRIHYRKRLETERVETGGANWMEPFARALGLQSSVFEPWEALFRIQADSVLLVEGKLDREYLEILRDSSHGSQQLVFQGEIISYDGTGQLGNTVLLRLIRNRCQRLVVTFDLDADVALAPKLEAAGLVRNHDFFAIGIDAAGKRCIEGLLPSSTREAVHAKHPNFVSGLQSDNKKERDDSKRALKKAYLEEFKSNASADNEAFKDFYKLTKKLNRAFAAEAF